MTNRNSFLLLAWLLVLSHPLYAQNLNLRPLQKLVDCPTAGFPESGSYDFELRAFPDGGLLYGFTVGILDRASFGFFHGGKGILGYSNPEWNPQFGLAGSIRLLDESMTLPALAVGYTNQGYGAWIDSTGRYQFRAKGLYAVMSKNYGIQYFGNLSIHLGANISDFSGEGDHVDYFAALDYHFLRAFAVIAEYSLALNDETTNEALGKGKGYLNLGGRWSFAERMALDLHLRDVLINQKGEVRGGKGFGREIRISYVEQF